MFYKIVTVDSLNAAAIRACGAHFIDASCLTLQECPGATGKTRHVREALLTHTQALMDLDVRTRKAIARGSFVVIHWGQKLGYRVCHLALKPLESFPPYAQLVWGAVCASLGFPFFLVPGLVRSCLFPVSSDTFLRHPKITTQLASALALRCCMVEDPDQRDRLKKELWDWLSDHGKRFQEDQA